MTDMKMSQLPAADALTGTEVIPVVQDGENRKATVAQMREGMSGVCLGSAMPQPLGTAAAAGTATAAAREDHVHVRPTSTDIGAVPLGHHHGNDTIDGIDGSKITSGTIDLARLPPAAIERLVKVADDSARLALTSQDVQLGDTVKVLATERMYMVTNVAVLGTEAAFEPYTVASASSVPWSGVTGKPDLLDRATGDGLYMPAAGFAVQAGGVAQGNACVLNITGSGGSVAVSGGIATLDLIGGSGEVTYTVPSSHAVPAGTTSYSPDLAAHDWHLWTLDADSTLANPTNAVTGLRGKLVITQDTTGGRTLSLGSAWRSIDLQSVS